MRVFKSLIERRNSASNEEASYQQQAFPGTPSRPPSVVTSTAFDDDEVFIAITQAMLFRIENQGMSEREAINAVLVTCEAKRGYLESMDLRSATMYAESGEDLVDESPINSMVQSARNNFGDTLKLLWRESITGYGSRFMDEGENDVSNIEYRSPLKTPKNLHSPIRTVLGETCGRNSKIHDTIRPKSSGRQRQRFFPDGCEPPRRRSRLRLDFRVAKLQPVHSLQLDGVPSPKVSNNYSPPSPITLSA